MSLDQTTDARSLIFCMKGHMVMLLRATEAIFKFRPRNQVIAKNLQKSTIFEPQFEPSKILKFSFQDEIQKLHG